MHSSTSSPKVVNHLLLRGKAFTLDQWVSTGGRFLPSSQGIFSDVWRHFCLPQLGGAAGIWWVEAKGAINILRCTGRPHCLHQQRSIQPQMSIVLRLRNPDLPFLFCLDLLLTPLKTLPPLLLKWWLSPHHPQHYLLLSLENEVNVILQWYFWTIFSLLHS